MKNITKYIYEVANKAFKFANVKSIGEESQKRQHQQDTKKLKEDIAKEYGFESSSDVCCGYCRFYSYNLGTGGTHEKGTCRNPNRKYENGKNKVSAHNWCDKYDFLDYCKCPRMYLADTKKYKWEAPENVNQYLKDAKI